MTKDNNNSRRFDGYKLTLLHDARKIILLVIGFLLIFSMIVGYSRVSGVSMMDTYHDGQLVFYTRINPSINRGDIVSIRLTSGEYYIKRVIGVAGDQIDLRDGVIYVNGQAENASYVKGKTLPENSSFTYPYVVGEGDLFVIGDNREQSVDSRSFGAVNARQVRGVIRFAMP